MCTHMHAYTTQHMYTHTQLGERENEFVQNISGPLHKHTQSTIRKSSLVSWGCLV
jgi:hypothetical protein